MKPVSLPWPPRELFPNFRSRSHWPKVRATAKARGWALLAAHNNRPFIIVGARLPIVITFSPPDARHRDRDGMLSACKAYLDGVAEAWGINDYLFDPQIIVGAPTRNGNVRIEARPHVQSDATE